MGSRTVATLHVTNGDSVVYLFKKAGILGTHVPWRDVLHEGPVPSGMSLEATSEVRAEYVAMRQYAAPIKAFRDFQTRDAAIRRSPEFEEIVLWFEHDLYDQLHLLQILHVLSEMAIEPGRVSLVQTDHYLGMMSAEELTSYYPKRRSVTAATFASAERGWQALTSDDPENLLAASRSDFAGLGFMRAAFRRLCEEYPWTRDGLSRSERNALQAVSHGQGKTDELFRRAQSREEAPFLGDTAFFAILDELRRDPAAIEDDNGTLVPTALGRRVLAGDADRFEANPRERWIGGVRIASDVPIRWDDDGAAFRYGKKAVDS